MILTLDLLVLISVVKQQHLLGEDCKLSMVIRLVCEKAAPLVEGIRAVYSGSFCSHLHRVKPVF